MGFFGDAHGSGLPSLKSPLPKISPPPPPLPEIFRTYPTMMKLGTVLPYLRKTQKIYKSLDTSLEFCWHQHFFHQKSANFATSRNTGINWILIQIDNSFNFVLNKCFNKHGYNFDDVSKNGYSRPS